MRCADCKWIRRKGNNALGECRRHPPVRMGMTTAYTYDATGAWPIVDLSEWCGEFTEEKKPTTEAKGNS